MIDKIDAKFKVGDTVKLNSGGPKMTVQKLSHYFMWDSTEEVFNGMVLCTWFEKDKRRGGEFNQATLVAD